MIVVAYSRTVPDLGLVAKETFMKNIVFSLTAGLMLVLACVSMWGCGDDDYRRWGGRYEGTLVAIIDDTLEETFNQYAIPHLESRGVKDWQFRLLNADDTGARVYIE